MEFRSSGLVEDVVEGRLRGQKIAKAKLGDISVEFDVISGILTIDIGDKIEIYVSDARPDNMDSYDFCGHGFLVEEEERVGKTVLSLWGILFVFSKPLGLKPNRKYYLCLSKPS